MDCFWYLLQLSQPCVSFGMLDSEDSLQVINHNSLVQSLAPTRWQSHLKQGADGTAVGDDVGVNPSHWHLLVQLKDMIFRHEMVVSSHREI